MLALKTERTLQHHVKALYWVSLVSFFSIRGTADCPFPSGLAWHTDDNALRAKFEEFGQVEEAVCVSYLIYSYYLVLKL